MSTFKFFFLLYFLLFFICVICPLRAKGNNLAHLLVKAWWIFWICECKICCSRCHVFPSVVSWEPTRNTLIYLCNPSVSQVPGLAVEISMSPVRNGWSETGTERPLGAKSYRGQVSRTASVAVMWQWQVVKRANMKAGLGGREKEKNLVIPDEIFSVAGSNGLKGLRSWVWGLLAVERVSQGCECSLLPWWLSTRDAQHKLPALNFWLNIVLLFVGVATSGLGQTPFRALNCW